MGSVLICWKNLANKLADFFNQMKNLYSLCKMNKSLMMNDVEYKLVYNYTHFNNNVFHQELSVKICGICVSFIIFL